MPKLTKQEIIELYKIPNSMTPMEIWRRSDYFNSISTIKKYISEAIDSGEITDEDIEAFRKREVTEGQKKEKRQAELKALVLKKILMAQSRGQIVQEIRDETGIETNTAEVGKLIKNLIAERKISQEEYEKILIRIRQEATRKTVLKNQGRKRKKEEGLEL